MTVNVHTLEENISSRLRTAVSLEPRGINSYRVNTPFNFSDGDDLKIIINKSENGKWTITDEGHTLMYLSYYNMDINAGTRADILSSILKSHYMHEDGGRLILEADTEAEAADSIFTFAQGILKISDMTMWKKERVKSMFYEYFREGVTRGAKGRELNFNYKDDEYDPNSLYPVDCLVTLKNGHRAHIYGANSLDRANKAIISMYHYEKTGLNVPNCMILSDEMDFGKTRIMLEEVADKILSSPKSANDRLDPFLRKYEDAA
ncbi:MAG: DUF1828 domain-containing protein [Synergistaceae bacterium]|nr:DUF1828 domain-containing protein [Synergistaceae bacterium]